LIILIISILQAQMINPENILTAIDPIMILNDSHDAFLVTDTSMRIIYSNHSAHIIFGYYENEMTCMNILDLMPFEKRESYSADMEDALSGKIVSNVRSGKQFFGLKKNGESFPIELTYKSINLNGVIVFISQIRDISVREKQSREIQITTTALRIINKANRLLIKSENENGYAQGICDIITGTGGYSKALILFVEENNGDTLLNYVASSGYNNGEITQLQKLSTVSIQHSGSPTIIAINNRKTNVCQDIIASGLWKYWHDDPSKMEFKSTIAIPLLYKDALLGLLRVFSEEPFSFKNHEIELLEELANDISYGISVLKSKSEHQKAQKALEESESRYKTLFQNSNDAIFLADEVTGIIIDANEKAEDLLGFESKEIVGIHYLELQPKDAADLYKNIFKNQSLYNKSSSEFYIRTKNGKAIPVHVSSDVIHINGKRIILGIFRDISQIKNHEEKIREIQKMEALGTLSGGIAHDINNILSPVIGFTQIAILESENRQKQLNCLNEVLTAANRAKEIVSQILTFSRKSGTEKKPNKINNVIKEVLKLISVSKPPNIIFETNIDDSCGPITCDPVQIYQVVINLCTNALYAMKEKNGILKVCLVKKGSSEIKIEQNENIPFDDYICLIVSDTGCGMSKTILNRIFEPYFTTKPEGESSGLGLSVVSGIVKEHNGEIHVRTYPKEGTYFRITFPVAEIQGEYKGEPKNLLASNKTLHVMIVDDEPQITFMFKYMLEELGCSSDTFNDPVIALNTFRSYPNKFDLILTDQTMPGLNGTELSRTAMEIKPDIPIILNTGYSPVVSKSEALKMGIKQFIMKPVTISDLAAALNNSI